MGVSGCVSFLFTEMGLITIVDEDGEVDEEKLMEAALEADAHHRGGTYGKHGNSYPSCDDGSPYGRRAFNRRDRCHGQGAR